LRLLHFLMAVCTAQVEAMLNEGIFDMQKYVDGGWVTGLKYEDEVMDDLKKRTGGKADKLRSVSLRVRAACDLAYPEHVCRQLDPEVAYCMFAMDALLFSTA